MSDLSSMFFVYPGFHEQAIKEWLEVIIRNQIPLLGGISGAKVTLVEATIGFPHLEHEFRSKRIRVVIKLSSKEGFDNEEANFKRLPVELKSFFVDFATPGCRALVDGHYCMIMPHLEKYQTLAYIAYHMNKNDVISSAEIVLDGLQKLHFPKGLPKVSIGKNEGVGKLISLYLADIQKSIERIFTPTDYDTFPLRSYLQLRHADKEQIEVDGVTIYPYHVYCGKLLKVLEDISPPFLTMSHGDCHSRNIMVNLDETDLKFLDIDKLMFANTGDYILDFGTLLADLEIYNALLQIRRPEFKFKEISKNKFSYDIQTRKEVEMTVQLMREHVQKAVKDIDKNWNKRLELSKARYLLNMATKTPDVEKAFVVYCEGMRSLGKAC
jgi:hypothetical protein